MDAHTVIPLVMLGVLGTQTNSIHLPAPLAMLPSYP